MDKVCGMNLVQSVGYLKSFVQTLESYSVVSKLLMFIKCFHYHVKHDLQEGAN